MRWLLVVLVLASPGLSQQGSTPDPLQGTEPPRADQTLDRSSEAGESSSRDSHIDLSPPKDDDKSHPGSGAAVSDAIGSSSPDTDSKSGEVQEFRPWDPYKAAKSVEVGDFYFKRKNYGAALDRYREALTWKNNDAVANFRMAQCQEKLKDPDGAARHYLEYLRILPQGPFAKEAHKALSRLGADEAPASADPGSTSASPTAQVKQ